MHLSPAEYVIRVFGGVRRVAAAIGRDPGAVCKWRKSHAERGTGGLIPTGAQRALLAKAAELDLDITCEDLIRGREVGDICGEAG
jgi:hypothetical protein